MIIKQTSIIHQNLFLGTTRLEKVQVDRLSKICPYEKASVAAELK